MLEKNIIKTSIPEKLRIQKGGGVLIIATDGATSTEMEYMKNEIIKKLMITMGIEQLIELDLEILLFKTKC